MQAEILENLSCPLPLDLVEPVLSAFQKGDPETRETAVGLLKPSLTPSIVEQLVDSAMKEKDLRVFRALLGAKPLPDMRRVVQAVLGAGLLPELGESFFEDPFRLDFSDEEALQGACESAPNTLNELIRIALRQVERGPLDSESILYIGRFLARAAFGPHPMDLRLRAYEALIDYRMQPLLDWLNPSVATQLFGGMDGLVTVIVSLTGNADASKLCYQVISDLYRCWDELVPAIGQNTARLNEFLSALHRCAKSESFPYLAAHTQLLAKIAPSYPNEVFPLLDDLLSDTDLLQRCREIPCYVPYEQLRLPLSERPLLAGGLVEALAKHLQAGSSMQYPQLIAMDMLSKVLTDFPQYRGPIAETLRSMMETLDSGPDDVKERLQLLAEVVGLERGAAESPDLPIEHIGPASGPPEELDHERLLPGEAVTTLADYVACLKEIRSAPNPVEVMAKHNLSLEKYMSCVSAWSDLISRREDVAIRYAALCAQP